MKRSVITRRETDKYLNGKKCVRESVPGPVESIPAEGLHGHRGDGTSGGLLKQRNGDPGKGDCMGNAKGDSWGALGLAQELSREPHATWSMYRPGALVTASPAVAPS